MVIEILDIKIIIPKTLYSGNNHKNCFFRPKIKMRDDSSHEYLVLTPLLKGAGRKEREKILVMIEEKQDEIVFIYNFFVMSKIMFFVLRLGTCTSALLGVSLLSPL